MRIVPIDEWGGTSNNWPKMQLPAVALWVHHSVTTASDDAYADFRVLNTIGANNGHGGISYSYVIHPNGTIGEGQATNRGAHTGGSEGCGGSGYGWNPCSFGVCFVGNYMEQTLTPEAIDAFRWLRDLLLYLGLLQPGSYPTGGHRDAPGNSTACPGNNIEDHLDALRAPYQQEEEDMKGIFIKAENNPKVWWWWGNFKSHIANEEVLGAIAYCGFTSDGQIHTVSQSLIDALVEIPFGLSSEATPVDAAAIARAVNDDAARRMAQ